MSVISSRIARDCRSVSQKPNVVIASPFVCLRPSAEMLARILRAGISTRRPAEYSIDSIHAPMHETNIRTEC